MDENEEHLDVTIATHDSSEETDLCTPFCLDKCCNVHIFCQPVFTVSTIEAQHKSVLQKILYIEEFLALVINSIWQPPRLS